MGVQEVRMRQWLESLLARVSGGRYRLTPAIRKHGRQLDGLIAAGERCLASVEFEARTDKQVRGAIFDLLVDRRPVGVLVWAAQGHGSKSGRSNPRLARGTRMPSWSGPGQLNEPPRRRHGRDGRRGPSSPTEAGNVGCCVHRLGRFGRGRSPLRNTVEVIHLTSGHPRLYDLPCAPLATTSLPSFFLLSAAYRQEGSTTW